MLFGNNNQGGGQGIFSNNPSGFATQNQNNTGGGLFGGFGNTAQTNLNPISLPASTDLNKPSMFGNTNNTGGGLFGGANNGANNGTAMFGNNNNNTTGGLFGNTNNGGGNLFGGANNNNNNGMFGNAGGNNNQGGFGNFANQNNNSFFGNNNTTAKPANTGFFGVNNNNNNNTGGGGLFGGINNNNNNTTNSIFAKPTGNTFTNSTNTNGSFFGAAGTSNTGGGLFSDANKAQFGNNNSNTGLFGNTQTNTNQQTGLFNSAATTNTNTFGNTGSFGNNNNSFGNNNNANNGLFGGASNNSFGNTNNGFNQPKAPFVPQKPRNEALNKQAKKALVYCVTLLEQNKNFSKEEMRARFLLNPNFNNNSTGSFGGNTFNNTSTAIGTSNGGGLFGNNQGQQPQGTGLFGQQANPNTNTGGLFGAAPVQPQGGGLFGNNTNPGGGGLFGAQPTPNNNTGGGLFGNNANNTGGGLFGNNSNANTNTNTGGGLFGNNTTTNNGGGLFGNTNNAGGLFGNTGGLLGSNQPTPQAGGLFGNTAQVTQPVGQAAPPTQQPYYTPGPVDASVIWAAALQLQQYLSPKTEERPQAKSQYGDYFGRYSSVQDYNVPLGYKLVPDQDFRKKSSFYDSNIDYLSLYQNAPTQDNEMDIQEVRKRYKRRNMFEQVDDFKPTYNSRLSSRDGKSSSSYSFYEKSNDINNPRKQTSKFQSKLFDSEKFSNKTKRKQSYESNKIAPQDIPICTKFNISPNLLQLSRMNKTQLQNVQNFVVRNDQVQVKFLQPIDLVGVNLDEVISLKNNCVDIAKQTLKIQGKVIIKYFNFAGYKQVTDPEKRNKLIKNILGWIKKMDVELLEFDKKQGQVTIRT